MSPSNHPLLQAPGQVTAKLRALPWVARNMAMDLRYVALLSGTIKSRHRCSSNVANSQYSVLPPIFDGRIGPDDVLVDVGCGKGLTMLYLNPAFVEVFDHDPRFGTEIFELPILDPRIEGRQRRLAVVRLAPA